MKKLLFICIACLMELTMQAQIVDLGLPSGTLWNVTNESGFYDYDSAVRKYGNKLPTLDQWKELNRFCTWEWIGNGYKVSGKNGKFIFLPAAGERHCDGNKYRYVGSRGYYWSSTPCDSGEAWAISFGLDGTSIARMGTGRDALCYGKSVHLVND